MKVFWWALIALLCVVYFAASAAQAKEPRPVMKIGEGEVVKLIEKPNYVLFAHCIVGTTWFVVETPRGVGMFPALYGTPKGEEALWQMGHVGCGAKP